MTSAGRRGELVSLLRNLGMGKVYAADMSRSAPALYLADGAFQLPASDAHDFIDRLMDLCMSTQIRYVVPTIDHELPVLARARARFEAVGVCVFVPEERSVLRSLDKLDTWTCLDAGGVPSVPTRPWDASTKVTAPVVVKPRVGASAKGVRIVARAQDLGEPPEDEEYVIQPFMAGAEVTVDVAMQDRRVAAIGARQREKVRGGEVERGVTVSADPYVDLAQEVSRCLTLDGSFNFQVFNTTSGDRFVSDVNPRLGGGLPLTQRAGGCVLEALFGLLDRNQQPALARSGVWMMRYDMSVFRDQESLLP